ncbi:phosphoglycolate phosphatase [Paenibacillus sp. J23TS9]|uniref:HAD family hydrolase n=1 Tax=Paenibacillus sp. J23TS9 TaxID=2807193 RepID=UPI001B293945|nr:HAD family hydrolase [Paenibacillus sp. J23TS9]GIP27474.1 phosphoglycolate phosphatase [Paenibacillus sp. J23TS9]
MTIHVQQGEIDGVLFDFDGTLADTLPLSFHAFKEVFRKYTGRDYTNEELVSLFGPTEDGIISGVLKDEFLSAEACAAYYRLYDEHHEEMLKLSAEIRMMLEELAEYHIPMGIITGKSRRSLDISLDKLGMRHYFDVQFAGDELKRPKPDREGIDRAMEALGIHPQATLFIGDSNADMTAGRAAGTRIGGAHWFEEVQNVSLTPEPDYLFRSPAEVGWLVLKNRRG